MATTIPSYTEIAEILNEQQETVRIIDEYIQPILLDLDPNNYADFVMAHIFVNVRNSYQDGIVLSQELMKNSPYYISSALAHAERIAQEFLIDLAYIMTDIKNKNGNEYLLYLKYMLTTESEKNKWLGLDNTSTDNLLNSIFPSDLELPKRRGQWTDTSRREKIEQGLKKYNIEPDHFADFRFDFHLDLSSAAHGNSNTIYTFIRTREKNLSQLEADFTVSIAHFDATLESALECYVKLYLGRNKDYRDIFKSMFPDKEGLV